MGGVLSRIEAYYDIVPREHADTEEVGPFTLFVSRGGWTYYARPRLGLTEPIRVDDVRGVLRRQRALGVPEVVEWVQEETPTLAAAAREAGLVLHECPLLVLGDLQAPPHPARTTVRMLDPGEDAVSDVRACVDRAFGGPGEVNGLAPLVDQLAAGLMRLCGAFGRAGEILGGGSHAPRGDVTEIVGVGVAPGARRRGVGGAVTASLVADAQSAGVRTIFCSSMTEHATRVYRALGFEQVGTAFIAAPGPR
jgi:ribosomal protein S18 acetylase RimI-like enzyme